MCSILIAYWLAEAHQAKVAVINYRWRHTSPKMVFEMDYFFCISRSEENTKHSNSFVEGIFL